MPTYIIEGKRVKTDGTLSEAEIDEIGSSIRSSASSEKPAVKEATSEKDVVKRAESKERVEEPTLLQKYNPLTTVLQDAPLALLQGATHIPESFVGMNQLRRAGKDANPYALDTNAKLLSPIMSLGEKALEAGVSGISGEKFNVQDAEMQTLNRLKGMRESLDPYKSQALQYSKQKADEAVDPNAGFFTRAGQTVYGHLANPRAAFDIIEESLPNMLVGSKLAKPLMGTKTFTGAAGPMQKASNTGLSNAYAVGAGEGLQSGTLTAAGISQEQGKPVDTRQAAISGVSGLLTGMFGVIGNKVARNIGASDLEEIAMAGASREISAETRSKLVNGFKSSLVESTIEEVPQSGQEQVARNLAMGKPWDEGVAEAMAQGFIAALPMGGFAGFTEQARTNNAITTAKAQKEAETARDAMLATQQAELDKQNAKQAKKTAGQPKVVTSTEDNLNKLVEAGEATNAGGPQTFGPGASTTVPGKPVDGATTQNTGDVGTGMDGAGSDVGTTEEGKNAQPTPLTAPENATPELITKIEQYNKRQEEIAAGGNQRMITNKTNANKKLLKDINETIAGLPPVTPSSGFTESEIKEANKLEVEPAKTEEEQEETPTTEEAAVDTTLKTEEVVEEEEAAPKDKKQIVVERAKGRLGKLAAAAAKTGRSNIIPEEEIDVKKEIAGLIFDAVELGYYKIEDAVEYVRQQLVDIGLNIEDYLDEKGILKAHSTAMMSARSSEKQRLASKAEQEAGEFASEADFRTERQAQNEEERISNLYNDREGNVIGSGRYTKDEIREFTGKAQNDRMLPQVVEFLNNNPDANLEDIQTQFNVGDKRAKKLIDQAIDSQDEEPESVHDVRAPVYEENRVAAESPAGHNIELPAWTDLSEDGKRIFSDALGGGKPSARQLHNAFEKVAEHLEKTGVAFRGKSYQEIQEAKHKAQTEESSATIKERLKADREKTDRRLGTSTPLDEETTDLLADGHINAVLRRLAATAKGAVFKERMTITGKFGVGELGMYLARLHKKTTAAVYKNLAAALNKVEFNSKVVVDPDDYTILRLQQEGKLAEYDPKTDTFYFTPEGLDEVTVLHEIVHAGTVKLIARYKADPQTLNKQQREAVEHLLKIYEFAKPRLSGKFKNAFENEYEFIAYAMTDSTFQNALANIQARSLSKYTAKSTEHGSLTYKLWDQFTQAMGKLYGVLFVRTSNNVRGSTVLEELGVDPDVYAILSREGLTTKSADSVYKVVEIKDLMTEDVDAREEALVRLAEQVKTAEETEIFNNIYSQLVQEGELDVTSGAELKALNRLIAARTKQEITKRKAAEKAAQKGKPKTTTQEQKTTTVEQKERVQMGVKKGYEGNALLEVARIFDTILSAPQVGTQVEPLPAKAKKPQKTFKAQTVEEQEENVSTGVNKKNWAVESAKFISYPVRHPIKTLRKSIDLFQSQMAPLMRRDRYKELAGEGIVGAPNFSTNQLIRDQRPDRFGKTFFNNTYELATRAAANATALFNEKIGPLEAKLDTAIKKLMGKKGYGDLDSTIKKVTVYLTGLAEPYRRRWLFVKRVPLRKDFTITINNVTKSPADFRDFIISMLDLPSTTEAQAEQLRKVLDGIIFTNKGNLASNKRDERAGTLNKANIDYARQLKEPQLFEENGIEQPDGSVKDAYMVTNGLTAESVDNSRQALEADRLKDKVMAVTDLIEKIQKETIALNKEGNYWSQPVSNRVAFYGFKHYIPFKGKPELADEMQSSFYTNDDDRTSQDYHAFQAETGGRTSQATDPIHQTIVDAKKAAFQVPYNQVARAVSNNIDQGHYKTAAKSKLIKFADKGTALTKAELQKNNSVFLYQPNGDILVMYLEPEIASSLRPAYRQYGEGMDKFYTGMSYVTRTIAAGHTLYNFSFAPVNMVKDFLTNLGYMFVDKGATKSGKYLYNMMYYSTLDTIMGGGMASAAINMRYYQKGDFETLAKRAKKSDYNKAFYQMAVNGYIVSNLQGASVLNQARAQQKTIDRGNVEAARDMIRSAYEFYFNAFENVTKVSAFEALRDDYMSKGFTEKEAINAAGSYTKNLSNFELSGKLGREMGSLYEFSRASSTGAVRGFDSFSYGMPGALERAIEEMPENIKKDPVAKKAAEKEYRERQVRSRILMGAMAGMGYIGYMAILGGSGDDDQGNNIVSMDDASRWIRNFRIPIPDSDFMAQVPYGYGYGQLAAVGAQVAILQSGNQSLSQFLSNIATISMDYNLPIAASRIPFNETPAKFFTAVLDTIFPSIGKPIVEYIANVNGLGQNILRLQNGKLPDAYSGSGAVPSQYKWVSENLYDVSNGAVDISPDSLFFFANSYAAGIANLGQNMTDMAKLSGDDKEFSLKTDTIVLNSLVGTRGDPYSQEYHRVEQKILKKGQARELAESKGKLATYDVENPFTKALVEEYEKDKNGTLKKFREEQTMLRNSNYSEKYRDVH